MSKFHVSADGVPRICRALHSCPLGDERDHYSSFSEATRAYELAMGPKTFAPLTKKTPRPQEERTYGVVNLKPLSSGNKLLRLGGVAVIAVTLVSCNQDGGITSWDNGASPPVAIEHVSQEEPSLRDRASDLWGEAKDAYQEAGGNDMVKEKAKEGGSALKEGAESAWREISESEGLPHLPDNPFRGGGGEQVQRDPAGVYFQGKPLNPAPEEVATAKSNLEQLVVAPPTGDHYDREGQYGRAFQTGVVGRLEHRDVTNGVFRNDAPQSRAIGGNFVDPYTGEVVEIERGSSQDTNVDHVVSLSNATQSGALNLSYEERVQLANDPANLAVVGAAVNREKSDLAADDWLPSYEPAQCSFVIAQITVKSNYKLSVTPSEKAALNNVLETRCS